MLKRYLIALLMQYSRAANPSCPTTPNYLVTALAPGSTPNIMHSFNAPVTKLGFCEINTGNFIADFIFNDSVPDCNGSYCTVACAPAPVGTLTLNAGDRIQKLDSWYKSDKVSNPSENNNNLIWKLSFTVLKADGTISTQDF